MKLLTQKDYPKEIHIGEETYTVKFVTRFPKGVKDRNCVGLCDPSTRTIYLKKGMSKSQLFRTFIHEILHGLEFEYDIPVPHKVVYQLEKAIGDLLMTNF
jgi:hypothetical protein